MKKIGIIVLVLVVALGAIGIGYAAWTDEIVVEGDVSTGSVCVQIDWDSWHEVNSCPDPIYTYTPPTGPGPDGDESDRNWTVWVKHASANISCPPGHRFAGLFADGTVNLGSSGIHCEDKDVAWLEFIPYNEDGVVVEDESQGPVKQLEVIVHNAYPYFAAEISIIVRSCSSIPIKLLPEVIDQDPSIIIEWGEDLDGVQWHPYEWEEVSWFIGVTQHVGHFVNGVWVVDDTSQPLTEQGASLSFTIDLSAIQWNEYPDGG